MNKEEIKEILLKNLEGSLAESTTPEIVADTLKQTAEKMVYEQPMYNFVGVQPMSGPVGLCKFLEYEARTTIEAVIDDEPWIPVKVIPHNEIISKTGEEMWLMERTMTTEAGTRLAAAEYDIENAENQESLKGTEKARKEIMSKVAMDLNKEIYTEIRGDLLGFGFKEKLDLTSFVDDDDILSPNGVISLTTKLASIGYEIGEKSKRGAGNFAIVSETIATILKFNGCLRMDEEFIDQDYGYVKYVGTLGGVLKIYRDTDIEHNKIVIGYKGYNTDPAMDEMDVGYVYAPYVPLMTSGIVKNPNTLKSVMKFCTRYGKAVYSTEQVVGHVKEDGSNHYIGVSNFYSELTIDGLPKIEINNKSIDKLVADLKETLLESHEEDAATEIAFCKDKGVTKAKYRQAGRLIPMVIDKLAMLHFVGVQTMTGPVGLLYLLRFRTAEEDGEGEGKRITLEVISETITAKSSKLDTKLTVEGMWDIAEGIAPNEKLNDIVTNIAKEIYKEIMNDVIRIAHKETIIVSAETKPIALYIAINHAANEIARKTRRGAGNYVIASTDFVKLLMKNKLIKRDMNSINPAFDYGFVKYIGMLDGTIKVFRDDTLEHNKCIIGYKGGNGEIDAGYFYTPYKLLRPSIVVDSITFEPSILLHTRYGLYYDQNSTETTSEDGLETHIKREPSNYFTVLTFEGLPEFKEEDVFEESMKNID